MNDVDLPWYVDLLGSCPAGSAFERLVAELCLEDDDSNEDSDGWIENSMGASLRVQSGKITAIIFFTSASTMYDGYEGDLPFGLVETMARDECIKILGNPDGSDAAKNNAGLQQVLIDTYILKNFEIILEYSPVDMHIVAIRLQLPLDFLSNT